MKTFVSVVRRVAAAYCLLFFSVGYAQICINIDLPSNEKYDFESDVLIDVDDQNTLSGNVFIPKGQQTSYPAIIFINSWVLEEHEYIVPAKRFAEKGYIVLSYSARGWGCSSGQVDVAGEKDLADLSAVIDWLETNTPVDVNNIGISGISYGSGIASKGLALEPRLKTAVVMSTWTNLGEALYRDQTPRLFWGFLLVSSGIITATLDPAIPQNFWDLITQQNIPDVLDWANARSLDTVVNGINDRNAPIYFANSFGDNLFQPNSLIKTFEKITSPKRLDLNQGTHATAEGFGLLGFDNYTWNNTHRWFDYWLKGLETGVQNDPVTTMKIANKNQRDELTYGIAASTQAKTFYFGRRGLMSNGELRNSPYKPLWTRTNSIVSGLDTTAGTGIPILSMLLDAHLNLEVKNWIPSVSRANGIVFESASFNEETAIRGIPSIELHVKPSYRKFQLVGYLYDVAPNGWATLITHGPMTRHNAAANKTQKVTWDLVATAYDVPEGHKVALAIDTFDWLYSPPTALPYSVKFVYSRDKASKLTLPIRQ